MRIQRNFVLFIFTLLAFILIGGPKPCSAAARKSHKVHGVFLGAVHQVPYSQPGDPAGAAAGETSLPIRALIVNGDFKDWTTGDAQDITGRTFVVRRALRLNNTLPGDKRQQWVWQRGPWLLVDRSTGHITVPRLPDYDPAVSRVEWFRDYAAYCGVTSSGKSLYAVVAELAVRKVILAKRLAAFDPADHPNPACAPVEWQDNPVRITFQATGRNAVSYAIAPGAAVRVENDSEDLEPPSGPVSASAPPAESR